MTDRELLELAAKAAGIEGRYASLDEFPDWMTVHDGEGIYYTSSQAWSPLTDDGDALRLAVQLGLDILFTPKDVEVIAERHTKANGGELIAPWACESWALQQQDPYAATRRAIVRAAAEIGRAMK